MTPWFRPSVAAAMIGGGLLTIALPVLVGLVTRRRTGASWRTFGLGAATFFASQVVLRLPWQIPLGVWLGPRLKGSAALMVLWLAVSALTAGLFEEVGRWCALRWFQKDERSFRVGVMLGAGHGGLEAIIVGVSIVGSGVLYVVVGAQTGTNIPPETLSKIDAAYAGLGVLDALAGAVERVSAVAAQIAMSVVVAQAFVRGRIRWLWIAVGMHFVVDFVFAGAAMWLAKKSGSAMVGELPLLPLVPLSAWIVWRLRPPREAPPASP